MNLLDRFISYISPTAGARRLQARATLTQIAKLTGSVNSPYKAAQLSRLNGPQQKFVKENDISQASIEHLVAQSWSLYRNNPSARKIVRNLEAKVIGKGMNPESIAVDSDGQPAVAFRARAAELWASILTGFDSRGLPGKGGLTMPGLQKLALRSTILSGDTVYRLKPIDSEKQRAHDIPVPVALQMVDSIRLTEDASQAEIPEGSTLFRGIVLNANGERVGYLISTSKDGSSSDAKYFPVDRIGHLYIEEDIDQHRGTPWFASAIISMQDTGDLNYNVLKASAMAACVVGTYSKPTGAARVGLNQSTSSSDELVDSDGNTINKIQPGMLINTGKDGQFQLMSPNQPNMNPEAFVQHLQRGTATAFPGIKSSTITGDYRNSSFSSERSADNDTWPELHDVQEWFAAGFCQPIYESVIRAGVLSGYFDGVITVEEFQNNPGRYCRAIWQGPIALSINPKDDATAAKARIQTGLSSPQMECRKVNTNWRDVLNDVAEIYAVAREKGIPEAFVNNLMGVDTTDQLANEAAAKAAAAQKVQNGQQAKSLEEAELMERVVDAAA